MKTKFTKGDWYCVFGDTYACVRVDGRVISDLRTVNATYNKHDARLIAAAPEMYEMLSDFLSMDSLDVKLLLENSSCVSDLLAKARGEK